MKNIPAIVTLLLALTGCEGLSASHLVVDSATALVHKKVLPPADSQCPGNPNFHDLHKKGGAQLVQGIQDTTFYGGAFKYAAFSRNPRTPSSFYSCLQNEFNLPVPSGFTPDWFGAWLVCSQNCDLSFGPANLVGYLKSSQWVPSRTYFLYLYGANTGEFLESYQVGPVTDTKRQGAPTLHFDSPFENGFTWPSNDFVALEVVHPSQ